MTLVAIRCQGVRRNGQPCRATLHRIATDALRPGGTIEDKCPACNAVTTIAGAEGGMDVATVAAQGY